MMQPQKSFNSKEYLLGLCNDFNLPVSPADNIETLENYLKAVTDESDPVQEETDTFLEEDPVYIGHFESAMIAYFKRLLGLRVSR